MRAVVLGIGNTILTDEAAGVRAVEMLEQTYPIPDEVLIIDGGTSGMEMTPTLAEKIPRLVDMAVAELVSRGYALSLLRALAT